MKFALALIFALAACVSAQRPVENLVLEQELRGLWDSLSQLVQQVLLPPGNIIYDSIYYIKILEKN